jgi:GntR family phosphonate transport system transcriptional regulator
LAFLKDGVPISIGLSFHCAIRFPELGAKRMDGASVTDIYHRHGITDYFRKRTVVFARRPDAEEAGLLMQHPDQPVMVLQKTDVDDAGQPISYSEAVWAADRVQFSFDSQDEGEAAPESAANV